MAPILVYGANGYTGTLVAERAKDRGTDVVLAGRNRRALDELGRRLSLPVRVFSLEDAAAVREGVRGMGAVLHCAGPFSRTSAPMVEACLAERVPYLDITGEIQVFEAIAARDEEARRAGIALVPGVGFDVVPSDCLLAHVARRLPEATKLAIGILALGHASRGTRATAVELFAQGCLVRRGGRLVEVPLASKARSFDFGRGERRAVLVPWGDVSTAYRSTGVPDIEAYLALPRSLQRMARLAGRARPLFSSKPAVRALQALVTRGKEGPTGDERARSRSILVAEATSDQGRAARARLVCPEGYATTAETALRAAERAAAGAAPAGSQTPSRAFGVDFILEVPGTERVDLD